MECGNSVSCTGEVFSRLGRKLKQQITHDGYLRVELHHKGAAKKHSVHRLVASAFVPNPEGKPQVNHKDGNKTNNTHSNLEWVTQSENQLHAYKIGLQKGFHISGRRLSAAHRAALCGSRWAGESRIYVCGGLEFNNPDDAAKHYGISRQTVYNRAASPRFLDWEIRKWREEK
jgi:hypothetical protein